MHTHLALVQALARDAHESLSDGCALLDDAAIADLASHIAAAMTAVDAATAPLVASGYLAYLRPSGGVSDPFGSLVTRRFLEPHTHSHRCEPGCALVYGPHVHSPACNHAPTPVGMAATGGLIGSGCAVWAAANANDAEGLVAALQAGGSTEEASGIGDEPVREPRLAILAPF